MFSEAATFSTVDSTPASNYSKINLDFSFTADEIMSRDRVMRSRDNDRKAIKV